MSTKSGLSRRDFLRMAAIGGAGSLIAACASPTPQVVEKQVTQIVEKPVEKQVTQIVEKPVEKIVEKVVTPTAPPPAKPVTLKLWDYDSTGDALWVQADKSFGVYFNTKYPNIKIERSAAPWTGYTEKFLTSVAGGAKYDVIYGWGGWLPIFIENKVVQPLDDFVANDPDIDHNNFYDAGKEMSGGKLYGLAWAITPFFVWFNKTAAEKAGAPNPKELDKQGKWDYDAWYNYAKTMTKEENGVRTWGFDMSVTKYVPDFTKMLENQGGRVWNEDFTQCLINSDEAVNLWEYVQKFYAEKLSPLPSEGNGMGDTVGFANQRMMGHMTGQNYIRSFVTQKGPANFTPGQAPMPKGPKGQAETVYINSFYMSSQGENPEAAWTWYKERSFSDAANKIYLPIGTGRFPARKDLPTQTEYAWEDAEAYDMIRKVMQPHKNSPKESEFAALYSAAWEEMVLQARPVKAILDQLAAEGTKLVQK